MSRLNKIVSCKQCRLRKVRCDRSVPCTTCVRHGFDAQCSLTSPVLTDRGKLPIPRRPASPRSSVYAGETSFVHALEGPGFITQEAVAEPEGGSSQTLGLATSQRKLHDLTIGALHDFINSTSLQQRTWHGLENPTLTSLGGTISQEERCKWQVYMAGQLPRRSHCDILVSYYFEHINWVYQAVRLPSFMHMYDIMWLTPTGQIDLGVASLLLAMVALSGLYISPSVCESFGMDKATMRADSDKWFRLSRQALHVGQYEARPNLIQLQVFCISQLYWYAMKAVETLNSAMGQAIRCAQALGLDRDHEESKNASSEMRHRLWWELCSSDIFQSLCLDRQPLIQAHDSRVPLPRNCNDEDMTATDIVSLPMQQPTRMSVHVVRKRLIKTFSKLFDPKKHNMSYDEIAAIDAEVLRIMDGAPWYMSSSAKMGVQSTSLPDTYEYLQWQHHIIHTFVCVQRIRIYRPFLQTQHRNACWSKCVDAVESTFLVYHAIRRKNPAGFQKSEKMLVQSYQIFSSAISTALFLLVERPTLTTQILNDIEVVMQDLQHLAGGSRFIPMATDGTAALAMILDAYQTMFCQGSLGYGASWDLRAKSTMSKLVQEVYSVMGGKVKAQAYLDNSLESRKGQSGQDEYGTCMLSQAAGSDQRDIDSAGYIQPTATNADSQEDGDANFFSQDLALSWIYDLQFDVAGWPEGEFT